VEFEKAYAAVVETAEGRRLYSEYCKALEDAGR